ncbi:MAG: N-acetylmuramoyl-L-alanine amidase-like domain-containing protein [Longimicrobiales bacterium]
MQYRNTLHAFWSVAALGLALLGCGVEDASVGREGEGSEEEEAWPGDVAEAVRSLRPREGTAEDWRILREKASWAWDQGIDLLPMGESMVRLGLSFVGTRYAPGTLELAGDESLAVNFEEFDCVTFVENVLALARFIRVARPKILDSESATRALYRRILTEIRYREGRVDGYGSRLHYFTDWILDNEEKGLVREITADLGGVEDPGPVDFMSKHLEAYRQLSDPVSLSAIQEREVLLGGIRRYRIPKEEIPARSAGIRDGDIIAATSTVDGLDVAHTGLAVWQGNALHLLHAPLVGESVEVSTLPLADRILRIQGQDGIRVVRPLEAEGSGTGLYP